MIIRLFIITFLMLLNSVAKSDPFTNEIGIIKEPEIVEVQPEEIQEPEDIIAEDIVEEITEDLFTEEPEQEVAVVETQPKEKEIITVLNIDPMLAYSLKDYTLKGTALSKESSNKFQRAKIKKFDRAKIPTTHTILENETIEKIAFRYGFSLREIELAV